MCVCVCVCVRARAVWLVLGCDQLGRSREAAGDRARWFIPAARQLRRPLSLQPQFPRSRNHSSHSHRALQRSADAHAAAAAAADSGDSVTGHVNRLRSHCSDYIGLYDDKVKQRGSLRIRWKF